MASYTSNLNLYKKDPAVDGDDTFNIETMLNENWDKIDEFALDMGAYVVAVNNELTQMGQAISSVEQNLATHQADDVKHITASERASWNAKETTTGSQAKVDAHGSRTDNPHEVTKSQVGLSNVENVGIETIRIDSTKKLRAEVKSSAPSTPINGDIWYDSTEHKFKGRANGAWV